jgi:hypothetical protein
MMTPKSRDGSDTAVDGLKKKPWIRWTVAQTQTCDSFNEIVLTQFLNLKIPLWVHLESHVEAYSRSLHLALTFPAWRRGRYQILFNLIWLIFAWFIGLSISEGSKQSNLCNFVDRKVGNQMRRIWIGSQQPLGRSQQASSQPKRPPVRPRSIVHHHGDQALVSGP